MRNFCHFCHTAKIEIAAKWSDKIKKDGLDSNCAFRPKSFVVCQGIKMSKTVVESQLAEARGSDAAISKI